MEFFVGIENNGNSTCLSVEGKKDPCSSLLTLSQKFNESSTIYVTGGEDWKNKAVPIFGTALFNFSVKIMPVIKEGSVEYAAFKPVCRTYIRSMVSFNMENISIDLSDFHQPDPPDVFVDHFICCREEVGLRNCNISGGEFVISLYSSVLVIYPVSSFVWFDNVSFCNFYMQHVMKPEWGGSAVHISVNTIPPQAFVPSEPQKNLFFSSIFFSLSSHAQITPRTHSQRNREEISFQNCLFRFMRSSSYGGCLHINAQKQNQDKYYHIEFCECHFEMSTSRRGGSFIYASLFDINQLSFPYTPPPKRNKSEDVWIGERLVSFNPAPFCYFGVGNLVNQLITPGKAFPVPDMIERQPVLLVTDSNDVLFGQHLLIDLDRDINFPFVPYSHSIKGLIDNPHTDHNRISFRYNTGTIDANGDPMYIKHSLARFVTFSRMWITDSEKLDFLCFIGVPLEPQSLDDHDNIEKCRAYFDADEESRNNTMSAQDCCGTAQMSCERLAHAVASINSDAYVVCVLGLAAINNTIRFEQYINVVAYEVSTVDPRAEIVFGGAQGEGGSTGKILVLGSGMALFYDLHFIMAYVKESVSDGIPALFYVEYFLYFSNCVFADNMPPSSESSAASSFAVRSAAARVALEAALSARHTAEAAYVNYKVFRRYEALILAKDGSVKMQRTSFADIRFVTPESSLIKGYLPPKVYEADAGHYGIQIVRCVFNHVSTIGNGSCLHADIHKNRRILISESSFMNVNTLASGGAVYVEAPSLANVRFTRAGLGFTIDNTGNGQYDCTKRCAVAEDAYVFTCICDPLAELEDNANGNFYDLSSNSNTTPPSFYGKTVYLSFTDQSIPTPLAPNFIGDNLEGLNNLHISYTLNHIRGFDENGEPILYTFEDVLGKHPPPRLGCLLIDAGKDPDICVANEDTNGNKICTITSDGEGRAVCDYISLQMQSAGFVTAQLLRLEIGKRMNMNVMLLTVGMFALMAWCGKKEKDQMDR